MIETELTDAQVLCALYNASKVQGMGFLQELPGAMTEEEAQELLDLSKDHYFDYLHGKSMKVDVSERPLDLRLYDRDNGPGAGQRAIENYGK